MSVVEVVKEIDAGHVLQAMTALGWVPGQERPVVRAIRGWLAEHLGNGSSPNRMVTLVPAAIVLASGVPMVPAVATDDGAVLGLPAEMDVPFQSLTDSIAAGVRGCYGTLAQLLDERLSLAEKDARSRTAEVRTELTGSIKHLEKSLVDALETLDTETARAESLAADLSAAAAQRDTETARADSLAADQSYKAADLAAATSRVEALEADLTAANSRAAVLAADLIAANKSAAEALAAALSAEKSRADVLAAAKTENPEEFAITREQSRMAARIAELERITGHLLPTPFEIAIAEDDAAKGPKAKTTKGVSK